MSLRETVVEAPFGPPVRGFATTRRGGVSTPPFDTLNLGGRDDDPEAIAANRSRLDALIPSPPHWLNQVHGGKVVHLDDWHAGIEADAAWTDAPGRAVAVLTADCLPVLLADRLGRCVAAVHAGWRGLAAGIVDNAVSALPVAPERLEAWIGPRISQADYEVGEAVRSALAGFASRFIANRPGHWLADLPGIAADQLSAAGVGRIVESGENTAGDPECYFSVRRDGRTGRMAALAWIDAGR
ncbi:MAG: peptidoglycan editing factor PgeF [Wenzhouxiangellaceae bacterium]|nr:peptidoglycan editing factor PgeF [Wenzhouxiangellaceae bacterium]